MKKTLLAVILFSAGITQVFGAGIAAQNTGCGLGTMLWNGRADGSTMSQTLQVTTNGTFGNQTFGITSGTLGCNQPASFVQNEKLMQFAAANLDNLAKEIAVGQGESLDTLAELMSIPAASRDDFKGRLQANFSTIFPNSNVDYAQVLDSIYTLTVNA